jgi:PAS domain S-box-containing protein
VDQVSSIDTSTEPLSTATERQSVGRGGVTIHDPQLDAHLAARTSELSHKGLNRVAVWASRLFALLLPVQWLAAVVLAWYITPYTWAGSEARPHPHLFVAAILGGIVVSLPVWLALRFPTRPVTRHAIAAAQMLLGIILIHVTNGRIETHFHIFVSLAFLSFFLDPRILVTGTVVVTVDHILRGAFWPQSLYGVTSGAEWRWLEHAGWVVFEDLCLLVAVRRSVREMRAVAEREAILERTNEVIEQAVKQRTAELSVSESRYRLLFEANPHPKWVLETATRRFLAVNDAAVTHYGYPRDQFLQITLSDLELPGSGTSDTGERPLASRGSGDLRQHRLASGDVRQMELATHPIEFDGRICTLVLAIDVTERKILEDQLKQAQKLESIGQLAAGIAHEINTPIQYIGDNTTFIAEAFRDLSGVFAAYRTAGTDPVDLAAAAGAAEAADIDYLLEEGPRALEQTLVGVGHVARIVKAMKEFAHPGTAEKSLIDLNRALETVVTVARNEWKYVAEVVTHLVPNAPLVRGLPGELNQVFLNLLVNAAHAVKAGNKAAPDTKGTIIVTTHFLGNVAEVRIADSGCGIPEGIRGRIYDQFFTTKPVGEGTGQGLAIAHAVVVKQHGGGLSFETEMGKGTTFIVRLPIDGVPLTPSERMSPAHTVRVPAMVGRGV